MGWLLLTAATASWAGGQAVWSYFELVAGRAAPFPSLADVGFLGFPVLAAVGLLLLPTDRSTAGSRVRNLLDGLIAAGSLLILSWASSLGATVSAGSPSSIATALAVAYPLGDVVVLTLVLLVLSRAPRRQRTVLVPLASGLVALAVADSTFLYATATGSYATGSLCSVGWTAGFALVAVGALTAATDRPPHRLSPTAPELRLGLTSAALPALIPGLGPGLAWDLPGGGGTLSPSERSEAVPLPQPSRLRLALPYLPLVLAQPVVTGQLLFGDRRAPAFEVVVALLLVVLVLTRQCWTLADNRALVLALRDEREAARHAALHDPLTGLANRTLFADRVAHALALRRRDHTATTVLFCDLDGFKSVNDGLGHAAGDALLRTVADRLRACLRPADTVARLGGDEFAVLIEGGPDSAAEPPGQVAGRLVTALAEPVTLSGRSLTVSVSIGLASACPVADDGLEVHELLRRADVAMYAAKGAGKATWVSYDPQRHTLRATGSTPPEQRPGLPVARTGEPA